MPPNRARRGVGVEENWHHGDSAGATARSASAAAVQTLRFGLDPYGFFESAHRAFGDVFTLRVMAETWVVLAHPDAVRELYRHGPDELDSGVANMSLRPLLGTQNVLLLDGRSICAGASSCCRRSTGSACSPTRS